MPSSYSTDLKIELMVTGENAGTWGNKTNDNLNVVQQAIAGYDAISIAGGAQTTNLTIDNSPTLSPARSIVLKFTGTITGNQIVTIPTGIEKTWVVSNGTSGSFTVQFKTTSGGSSGTTWSTTDKGIKILYSDGTEIYPVDLDSLTGNIANAQLENLSVTSAKLASFAVTEARLASFAITTAKLDTNAVTAIKITQSTITQSKLAANSVGASQLISTGVVAATYTLANITVDADGRITSASSGSAGAGMEIPTLATFGPASGTYTASPTANRIGVYMYAGGGGDGASGRFMEGGTDPGGTGGSGGFGFYNKPITQPFSQPYSIGAGGTGGNLQPNNYTGNPGNAGGATNLANVGTVNGGNAGNGAPGLGTGGNPGNPGTQPGASLAPNIRQFIQGTNYGKNNVQGALIVFENIGT